MLGFVSDFISNPIGTLSNSLNDIGSAVSNVVTPIWQSVSSPFVDTPLGRSVVNYATGGAAAPFYVAYDASRGKNIDPLSAAIAMYQGYNAFAGGEALPNTGFTDAYDSSSLTDFDWGNLDWSSAADQGFANYMKDFNLAGLGGGKEALFGAEGASGFDNTITEGLTSMYNQPYGGFDTGAIDLSGTSLEDLVSSGGLKQTMQDYLGFNTKDIGDFLTKYKTPIQVGLRTVRNLDDMFAKRRLAADLRERAGAVDAYMRDLQGRMDRYYAPDSPEALAMRQRLERLDAKAGRNSQYGAREAQLASELAKVRANYAASMAPTLSQLMAQQNNLRAASSALDSGSSSALWRTGADIAQNWDSLASLF